MSKTIREELGLTQQEWADFLEMDRTAVAQAERGLRLLPMRVTKFLILLAPVFEQILPLGPKQAPILDSDERDQFVRKLEHKESDLRIHIHKIDKRLEKLDAQYEKCQRRLAFCHGLSDHKDLAPLLNWVEAKTRKKLRESGPKHILELQIRKRTYEAELAVVREELAKLKR